MSFVKNVTVILVFVLLAQKSLSDDDYSPPKNLVQEDDYAPTNIDAVQDANTGPTYDNITTITSTGDSTDQNDTTIPFELLVQKSSIDDDLPPEDIVEEDDSDLTNVAHDQDDGINTSNTAIPSEDANITTITSIEDNTDQNDTTTLLPFVDLRSILIPPNNCKKGEKRDRMGRCRGVIH